MGKGFPNVSQYRFYKKMPIRASIIYPYLAASGVTQIYEAGHGVQFMDCPTEEKTWEDVELAVDDADLVILEGRTPIIREIWKAIWKLKGINPRVKVAVYGDHVSWDPQETLDKGADFIIKGGDFDYGARVLCEYLRNRKAPPHVLDCGLVNQLDGLPWVDRELVDWRNYFESWKTRDVFLWNMSMRGCPFHCVYCAWAGTFWDYKLRRRSPRKVADETRMLHQRYGDLEILDDADLFDMRWGVDFARQLLSMGLGEKKVLWSCQTHPSMIRNLDELREMKKSGLNVVKLGVESGSDMSLIKMEKGSSRSMIEHAIKLLQEADVQVHANMMIGFPWESRESVMETLSWLKDLDPNQAQFSLVIPYPNTELWQIVNDEGLWLQDPSDWSLYNAEFPMIRMKGLSGEEIVDLYRKCWSSFYLNRRFIWKQLTSIHDFRQIVKLYHGFRSIVFGHMRAVKK